MPNSFEISLIGGVKIQNVQSLTILNSAMISGVNIAYSCKTGRCGICKVNLLEGEIKELQAQSALTTTDRENHKILTCCCQPITDILIDAEDLTAMKGIKIKTLPARISKIHTHSSDIIEIQLRFPSTANFKFLEGQYLDVLWSGIRRSYSIASKSLDKEVTLLVKKVEKGVMSDYWFNQAKLNDLLRIEGPKGTFFLRNTERPLIMLATGTGIAPIMSILRKLDQDENYQQLQSISIFWGNRLVDDFVWQPEFKNITVNLEKIISKTDLSWSGKTGYIQNIALETLGDKVIKSDVYACGSNEMIQSAKQCLMQSGLREGQFYSDAFVQSY
jgi:CDP-4-dehydro-6-deoxyglucose reductase, E3